MNKREIIGICIAVVICILAFNVGMYQGAEIASRELITLGLQLVDIELTPQALAILQYNPKIIAYALASVENKMANVSNPYNNHPQASLKWEYCRLTTSYADCYYQISLKYGEPIYLDNNYTL